MAVDFVHQLIRTAFKEDDQENDITSLACFPHSMQTKAAIILKQPAKVAGMPFLSSIFHAVDKNITIKSLAEDGKYYEAGTILCEIEGPASHILSVERTALNLLQHLSGIATLTSLYVEAVKEYPCDILDTRKTLPGLRWLQKYAVKMGGGKNHRLSLSDRFLVKNNHLCLLKNQTSSPIGEAVKRARALHPNLPLEIEVENLDMLQEAIDHQVPVIMLDNMSLSMVKEAVKITNKRAYLEASGGIHLKTVRDYAATGVDGISIGALTHSVHAIDMSLRVR